MIRQKMFTLLLSLPVMVVIGCTPSTQNNYERDKPAYQANVVKDKRFETDSFLAAKARLLEIRQTTVQGDLLKINALVMNDDNWDGDIDYKFEWLDDQGMIVDTPLSTWNTQHFGPKETIVLQSVAPTPRCKDFHLKMQLNQRN